MKDEHYQKRISFIGASKLRKLADQWFSRYIRLINSDDNGDCLCCTCGVRHGWKDIDNGHFIRRRILTTRWDENNCHPQCTRCNKYLDGAEAEHFIYIEERYGRAEIERLIDAKRDWDKNPKSDAMIDLPERIIFWKNECKRIAKEKNITL